MYECIYMYIYIYTYTCINTCMYTYICTDVQALDEIDFEPDQGLHEELLPAKHLVVRYKDVADPAVRSVLTISIRKISITFNSRFNSQDFNSRFQFARFPFSQFSRSVLGALQGLCGRRRRGEVIVQQQYDTILYCTVIHSNILYYTIM